MKKYSSNRAQKGKTGYRTPSRFKVFKSQIAKAKVANKFTSGLWPKKKSK